MPATRERRREVLRRFGGGGAEAEELLAYNESRFGAPLAPLPLDDEPFVAAWEGYAAAAAERGAVPVLREVLPQLRFPVRAGISETEAYRAATRRGVFPAESEGEGVAFEDPGGVRLFLHPTPAGRVPVLVAARRADFVALVRALSARNEPKAVPDSMGACAVGGYPNWERMARLRERFERGEMPLGGAASWAEAFPWVRERKELYQDRFVLLSSGPYSGVPAAALGMEEEAWLRASLTIRLEHECAHYLTRRVLGSMRNALHDELLADYAGVAAAAGRWRSDWFLRFMGLEEPRSYRVGGRLENYRGDPALSGGAFAVLQRLVRRAAAHLEAVDARLEPEDRTAGRAAVVLALARFTLEEIACDSGPERILGALREPPAGSGPGRPG